MKQNSRYTPPWGARTDSSAAGGPSVPNPGGTITRRSIQKNKSVGCLRGYGRSTYPAVRVVCFTWCGAGALSYRKLAGCLPENIELLAVQLPGREDRMAEPRLTSMEQIVDHVIKTIIAVSDRPMVLFGHSLGALIAHEVALSLRAITGEDPLGLIVSGHAAPDCTKVASARLHRATEAELITEISKLGGTPPEVLYDQNVLRTMVPILRADYEAVETYVYKPRPILNCPMIACSGNRDLEVSVEGMTAWRNFTKGPCNIHWFDGDHFYFRDDPTTLARALHAWCGPEGFLGKGQCATRSK